MKTYLMSAEVGDDGLLIVKTIKHQKLEVPKRTSFKALVRRAKRAVGMSHMLCHVTNYGDMVEIFSRPRDKVLEIHFENHLAELEE